MGIIEQSTINAVQKEAARAWDKHGNNTLLSPLMDRYKKLAILGEEFGEVCGTLTYDKDVSDLVEELIQLATMALMWASSALMWASSEGL